MRFTGNLLQHLPLTVKMVILTVLLGSLVGFIANLATASSVRKLFEQHVYAILEQDSLENRIRFDNYLTDFRQMARLFSSHEKLLIHLDEIDQVSGPQNYTRFRKYPGWFPGKSLMRSLAIPRFMMIYSGDYTLLEMYYAEQEKYVPQQFYILDPLSIQKSHGVTHITSYGGFPYILSSSVARNRSGREFFLVFASPVDELFFLQVRGDFPQQLSGLLSAGKRKIMTSSDPRRLPNGTSIDEIQKKYLIHYHEYHEYGGAEMQINFASFTPRDQVTTLTDTFMETFKATNRIIVLSIVVAFALLMYAFSMRIERITTRIREFSLGSADNAELPPISSISHFPDHGDEITMLDNSFSELFSEIDTKASQLQATNVKLSETIEHLVETRGELLKAEKMAVVGQMSAIMAHELLNPITSIVIRVEKNIDYARQAFKVMERLALLMEEIPSAPVSTNRGGREYIRQESSSESGRIINALIMNQKLRVDDLLFLETELNKVIHIVDGFRQMARKEKVLEEVSLVAVLEDVLEEMADKLRKNGIALNVDIHPVPVIKGDFMEFHSIIGNLVNNAIQAIAGKADPREKKIGIFMAAHENYQLEIQVKDSGTGIPAEHLEHIFDPSFTTKGRDGTGLGLAISRKIARSYNGDLTVLESRHQEGATFQVLLEEKVEHHAQERYAGR